MLDNLKSLKLIWKELSGVFLALLLILLIGIFLVKQQQGVLIWTFALIAIGFLIGFFFGIPKIYQNSTPSRDYMGKATFLVNTNLEQISDWLTKIIVGIGLVQIYNAWTYVKKVAFHISNKNGEPESFAIAMVPLFLIIGFFAGYLITRIYLTSLFKAVEGQGEESAAPAREALPPLLAPAEGAPPPAGAGDMGGVG